jgi:GAF domain-containing protein
LEQQREHLEVTVEERTRELERRSRYLEATAEVAREASSLLDLEQLLTRVVALISERFVLYRMGIFLLDPSGEEAVLRAASGEGGRQLLDHGFGVRVDGKGIVAYVIRSGRLYVAQDVTRDSLYLDAQEVADTRSELTLPLRARGEILGALSVQSPEVNAFSTEDVSTMQILADQVALAISNAQLFQQAQDSLEAERRAYGELSRQAWQELLRIQPDLAIVRDQRGVLPLDVPPDAEVREAIKTGRSAVSGDGGEGGPATGLAVPIRVRGQVIGAIDAHKPAAAGAWTPEQIALLELLSEQVGDALEDARLYQETQRRAAQERLTSEVTARMRETLDVERVLQAAVAEMRQALGLARVEARLDVDPEALGSRAPAARSRER